MQIVRVEFNKYYCNVLELNARSAGSKNFHIKLPILRESLQITCFSTTLMFTSIHIKTDSVGNELYNMYSDDYIGKHLYLMLKTEVKSTCV